MCMSKEYVVAVYDFRSKQEYIYRTNKVKEIIGASELIKNAYRKAIEGYDGVDYVDYCKGSKIPKFSLSQTEELMERPENKGMILYEGGGNIVLLFQSREECLAFNKHFSWFLLTYAPGLNPICGMTIVENGEESKFGEVTGRLYRDLEECKRTTPPVLPANVLPFTQIDRKTSLPVMKKSTELQESFSAESHIKQREYKRVKEKDRYVRQFDWLVEQKGTESLIAVIYIDGNNMRQLVQEAIGEDVGFEEGVNQQRRLTKRINDAFVDVPIERIKEKVGELMDAAEANANAEKAKMKGLYAMRRIIGGGDEITIVCNARRVPDVLEAYFDALKESSEVEKKEGRSEFSACAGVVVCHSHAPFSDVYAIAEECCESGKGRIRTIREGKEEAKNNCYMDAYFCRGAITGDLKALRTEGGGYTNMPYLIRGVGDEEHSYEKFVQMGAVLQELSRTNVKALRDAAFQSPSEFELELLRVKANDGGDGSCNVTIEERELPVFCDAAEFYDIWFRKED